MSVRVAGGKGGELRLVYQVNGPGWTPACRAALRFGDWRGEARSASRCRAIER